jgi:hypothetical protein
MTSLVQQNGTALPANSSFAIAPRLAALIIEHDDLDLVISALQANGSHDDLMISRLKKRKLQIKDEIAAVSIPAPIQSVA